jgi:hypothetical protein
MVEENRIFQNENGCVRKPYVCPVLTHLGALDDLTRGVLGQTDDHNDGFAS